MQRSLPFAIDPSVGTVEFPAGDTARNIPTRLGEQDRLVRFPEPVASPFDPAVRISDLTLPHHLVAPGTPRDAALAEEVERGPLGVAFRFGSRRFAYDRLGLRQMPRGSGEAWSSST